MVNVLFLSEAEAESQSNIAIRKSIMDSSLVVSDCNIDLNTSNNYWIVLKSPGKLENGDVVQMSDICKEIKALNKENNKKN